MSVQVPTGTDAVQTQEDGEMSDKVCTDAEMRVKSSPDTDGVLSQTQVDDEMSAKVHILSISLTTLEQLEHLDHP